MNKLQRIEKTLDVLATVFSALFAAILAAAAFTIIIQVLFFSISIVAGIIFQILVTYSLFFAVGCVAAKMLVEGIQV